MKKWVKITLISFVSLLGILLIVSIIAVSIVLSPKQLTTIVNKEAPQIVTCDFSLQKADLTFFKTFPFVGVSIHQLTLKNEVYGAPSDTLLDVEECTVVVNIRELLKNKHIIVKKVFLKNGYANLFVNEQGKLNFDVLKIKSKDTTSSEFDYTLDLKKVQIQNVNINYLDLKSLLSAKVQDFNLDVKGQWQDDFASGKVKLNSDALHFSTLDSSATHIDYDKLQFRFEGTLVNLDQVEGTLKLNLKQTGLEMDHEVYLNDVDLKLSTDFKALVSKQMITLEPTELKLDDYVLQLQGSAQRNTKTGDLLLDVQYRTERWPLKKVLAWLPKAILGDALKGLNMDGKVVLDGTVKGHCNSKKLPIITANIDLNHGSFSMDGLPLAFQKIKTHSTLNLDLKGRTDLAIHQLSAYAGRNYLTAKGSIRDLLDEMLFDLALTGNLHLADFKQILPDDLTALSGDAVAAVKLNCNLEQLSNVALDQMAASGKFQFQNLQLTYNDSLALASPKMDVEVRFPVSEQPYQLGEWAEATINATQLTAAKVGLGDINATNVHLDAFVNNLMDSTLQLMLGTTFAFDQLTGKMDTINAMLEQPKGTFVMRGSDNLSLDYLGQSLWAQIGTGTTARTGPLELAVTMEYNEAEKKLLMQLNPTAKVDLSDAKLVSNGLLYPLEIKTLKADVNTSRFILQQCHAQFGESDLEFKGTISDIDKFLRGEKLLRGDLELLSNYININQIMDAVNGYGNSDSERDEEPEPGTKTGPFMVPKNVNVNLHTTIRKALFEDAEIRNLGGNVSVKNGILVLDQMGLTSDAARIQLTALYKSPRRNNLILGLDFHLLDVKIAELIDMIPEVDTVLPMLKNFAGNAEFHFAISTNLNANYELKYSTLRGAAAISGKDLVVLDNETYHKISKLLLFKKKTTNKIDSLSAEMTIFKNEVDIYPFAVSIDKYQAILSGRHNLDMTYDYNITLAKPVRLGLNIEGTDKLRIRLVKPKYAKLYNPRKQGVLEQNTMSLKNQIRQALEANVKPQDTKE